MTLDEAMEAVRQGKEVTHKYLQHSETKSLRFKDGKFYDKEGYYLNSFSVMVRLQQDCYNEGWSIVEHK